jgi:hypothetical protein
LTRETMSRSCSSVAREDHSLSFKLNTVSARTCAVGESSRWHLPQWLSRTLRASLRFSSRVGRRVDVGVEGDGRRQPVSNPRMTVAATGSDRVHMMRRW